MSTAVWPLVRLPNTSGTSSPWQAPSAPPMPGAGQVEFEQVGAAAAVDLRLRQVQARHPEQPVGVDQLIQFLVGGVRERGPVVAGRQDGQGGVGLLAADLAEDAVDQAEQPVFVAGVPGQQRRCRGRHPRPAPARAWRAASSPSTTGANGIGRWVICPQSLRPPGHRGEDGVPGGGQQPRFHRRQAGHGRRHAQLGGEGRPQVGGQAGEKNVPGTLWAIARWKSPAARGMASSAATDPPPADWPKTVTLPGSPPKARDAVADPFQGGDLVEQPAVGGGAADVGEALDAVAVVEGDRRRCRSRPGARRRSRAGPSGPSA